MNKVLIDDDLLERLDHLDDVTEFFDADGKPLGRFIPDSSRSKKPGLIPPQVADPEERAKLIAEMIKRMKSTPLLPGAPKLTRDDLHDRG